jgi:hypothetical protein
MLIILLISANLIKLSMALNRLLGPALHGSVPSYFNWDFLLPRPMFLYYF